MAPCAVLHGVEIAMSKSVSVLIPMRNMHNRVTYPSRFESVIGFTVAPYRNHDYQNQNHKAINPFYTSRLAIHSTGINL